MSTRRGLFGANRNPHWREARAKGTAAAKLARQQPAHWIAWVYRVRRSLHHRRPYERGEF